MEDIYGYHNSLRWVIGDERNDLFCSVVLLTPYGIEGEVESIALAPFLGRKLLAMRNCALDLFPGNTTFTHLFQRRGC